MCFLLLVSATCTALSSSFHRDGDLSADPPFAAGGPLLSLVVLRYPGVLRRRLPKASSNPPPRSESGRRQRFRPDVPSLGKSWRGSGTSTCWLVCCSDAKEGQQQRGAQCEAVEAQRASEPRVDWRFRFLHLLEAWGRTPLQLALEQTGGPAQIRGALPIVRHRKWARPCPSSSSPRDAVHGVRRREGCGAWRELSPRRWIWDGRRIAAQVPTRRNPRATLRSP